MLPNNFDKPLRLYDRTNKNKVEPLTEEEYTDGELSSVVDATTGQPRNYRIYGVSGVTTAVSTSGSTVQVKSSSASDTASVVVRVEGYIDSANLILDYENITVSTGTPTTFVAGTKTFYRITHVSKSANTTGYITIANSSSTTLETLAPTERVARHRILKLGLIPAGAYSMRLLYKRKLPEMVNDYDYPFTECDRYLIFDAFGWALKQDKEDTRAEHAWNKAAEALNILLRNQNAKLGPDYQHRITNIWVQSHRPR